MVEFEQVRTVLVAAIALSLAGITVLLWRQRPQIRPRHLGFDAVLLGMGLVSAAALVDAVDLESIVAGTGALNTAVVVLQLLLGYLGGILLIGVGLSFWVPSLVGARREAERRRAAEDALLTSQVDSQARGEALRLANETVRRLHSLTDPGAITREAIEVLIRQVHAPRVALYLLDDDRQTLRLSAEHRFDPAAVAAGRTLPVQGSLSGAALSSGDVLVCADLATERRLEPAVGRALVDGGFSSGVIIPLEGSESVLGTVNLIYQGAFEPTPTDVDTFRAVGRMVALAIENARHRADLEHRARHDQLTGLANRFGLRTDLDERLRQPDAAVGLVVFDVARFVEVNEALGYEVGDQLLQEIASRLRGASGCGFLHTARLGGDEFAAVCGACTSGDELEVRARSLLEILGQPYPLHGFELSVGLSAGAALAPGDGANGVDLIRSADIALRHAKQTAGGVVRYHSGMMRTTPERLELTSALRAAIADGQLTLYYQPKFRLSTRRLIGFEALIRWLHPTLGLLPPREFIPLAEMTDAIQPLTRWVMQTALEQLATWQQRDHQLTMAVNLSARNLNGRDCGVTLREIAHDAGVDPHDVIVELTETALMIDPVQAEHALHRIADAGACLAIDDFGTGYSSLTHLTRFPVRALKIDQSFVSTMLDSEQSRAIVRSTIAMARDLGLSTVAEGVESETVAEALLEMGCDEAQGFVLGAPVPPDEVEGLLA